MKDLRKKIEFTPAQENAIAELNAAFKECQSLGVDFAFDHSINSVVAMNLSDAELQHEDSVDTDKDVCIAFHPATQEELDDSDAYKCEVGPQMYYTDECYDRLYFVNKTNK